MSWLTKLVLRSLEFAGHCLPSRGPQHLLLGRQGELEAYLHLRSLGYKIVAGNFRVPHNRGEIDLIGWDEGVLCFIEVKTRTDAGFAPPSAAVDLQKKRHILSVARRYLRRLPGDRPPPCRFDIVSIVMNHDAGVPQITLHKGAFSWDAGRPRRSGRRNGWRADFRDRYLRRRR
jgi:putative endonuclease